MGDGKAKRIGLALSGGGFRAAAFHLGVFRQLKSLGLLQKVELLSCVSGGSIAGAVVALGWNDVDAALDRLEHYVRTRSIAVSSVLTGLLDPFETRTEKLAQSYDADLFRGATLGQLKDAPRTYFNATNLATGNLFFIAAGGGKPAEMGDHELGHQSAESFLVSRAVAASSSFPPVFPPLRLSETEFPRTDTVEYVTLTDGGVYDNLGINPTLLDRNPLEYVLISDAGKPFAINATPTESGLMVMPALIEIVMEQVRGLQFDRVRFRHLAEKGPRPLWFSIDSDDGENQPLDAQQAGAIQTNLKRLTDREITLLMRHGAALVKRRVEQHAPELLP